MVIKICLLQLMVLRFQIIKSTNTENSLSGTISVSYHSHFGHTDLKKKHVLSGLMKKAKNRRVKTAQ